MKNYSGFYYNVPGLYEDIIYYISPMPEQKLYMIKKYAPIINTNDVLKSIETGYNGSNYEVYGINLKTFIFDNPEQEGEIACFCEYEDFSNKQVFEGLIVASDSMPNFDEFEDYLAKSSKDLPLVIQGDTNEVIPPKTKPVQQVDMPQVRPTDNNNQ